MNNQQLGYAVASLTPIVYYAVGRLIKYIPSDGLWRFPKRILLDVRNDIQNVILSSGFCYALTLIFPKIWFFVITWKLIFSMQLLLVSIAFINIISDVLIIVVQKIDDANDRINYATAIPLLISLIKICLYFLWLMLVLAIFGINVAPFFQGTAMIALIVGLAGQKTIEAFFGTIIIFSDKIYRVGSVIRYKEYSGRVNRITIFRTFITTQEGYIVSVTNSEISVVVVIEP